jgi:hypothetical protein
LLPGFGVLDLALGRLSPDYPQTAAVSSNHPVDATHLLKSEGHRYLFPGRHLINASAISKVFHPASNVGSLLTFVLSHKVLYEVGIPVAVTNILGGFIRSKMAGDLSKLFLSSSLQFFSLPFSFDFSMDNRVGSVTRIKVKQL